MLSGSVGLSLPFDRPLKAVSPKRNVFRIYARNCAAIHALFIEEATAPHVGRGIVHPPVMLADIAVQPFAEVAARPLRVRI